MKYTWHFIGLILIVFICIIIPETSYKEGFSLSQKSMLADNEAKEARQIANKARNDANEANKKVYKLTSSINALNATLNKQSKELKIVLKNVNTLTSSATVANNEYLKSNNIYVDIENKRNRLTTDLTTEKNKRRKDRNRINELTKWLSHLENNLKTASNDKTQKKIILDNVKKELEQTTGRGNSIDYIIKSLTQQITSVNAELDSAQNTFKILNDNAISQNEYAIELETIARKLRNRLSAVKKTPQTSQKPTYIWKIVINNFNTFQPSVIYYSNLELKLEKALNQIKFTEQIKENGKTYTSQKFTHEIGKQKKVDLYILVYRDNTYKISSTKEPTELGSWVAVSNSNTSKNMRILKDGSSIPVLAHVSKNIQITQVN